MNNKTQKYLRPFALIVITKTEIDKLYISFYRRYIEKQTKKKQNKKKN